MSARLRITMVAHWVNAAVIYPLARPMIVVDGRQYQCQWRHEEVVAVPEGEHTVETYMIYKGTRAKLGTGSLDLRVAAGGEVVIHSRNGWLNHMPFRPVIVDSSSPGDLNP
jgi:hypothetical protein